MPYCKRKKAAWFSASLSAVAMAILALLTLPQFAKAASTSGFRPPAVPLLTYDPYLNIWAGCTRLPDHHTKAWTKQNLELVSLIRVDGKAYRLMGGEPRKIPALHQTALKVLPLESIYHFAGHGIALTLTFLTPRLPGDLAAFGRPVNYLTWRVHSTDGKHHTVQIYYSTSSRLAVKSPHEKVVGQRQNIGPLVALKIGSLYQPVLANTTPLIDWGYIYTAAPRQMATAIIADNALCQSHFIKSGKLPTGKSTLQPGRVSHGQPVEALAFDLGRVGKKPVSRMAMVALAERYSVELNGTWLRPYWMHTSPTASDLLKTAAKQYRSLQVKSEKFDRDLWASCAKVGGQRYAQYCALAYRQSIGMMGMAEDANGQPLLFTDENTSGGDISTVDVIFPSCPQFLLLNPDLLKAMLVPVFEFSSPSHWPQPYSLHDLGGYPIANGHPGGGGELMPVEESGNMIIMTAAISEADGNTQFAQKFWPLITTWVKFLRKRGFDPGKQLSTNDFLGPVAHNANLSIKAIIAMGAYGKLCQMRGLTAQAASYHALARRWAKKWMKIDATGNHYRMAFNQPNSWSMLYNLAWDQVLHLHIFPMSVRRKQMAFYMTKLNKYGLPDRSTVTQTKTDFETWTATLATKPAQFHAIINRIYKFLDQSPARVGLADQYGTRRAWAGMYARPVMGAAFLPMLIHRAVWLSWAAKGQKVKGDWVPLPAAPQYQTIVPTSAHHPVRWRYTLKKPPAGWYKTHFNDSQWQSGLAGFGTGDPHAHVRTHWSSDHLWLRRTFVLPRTGLKNLVLYCYHDDGVKIYINGVLANRTHGWTSNYLPLFIRPNALKALRPGHKNVFAVRMLQHFGGQFFDLGLSRLISGGPIAPKSPKPH